MSHTIPDNYSEEQPERPFQLLTITVRSSPKVLSNCDIGDVSNSGDMCDFTFISVTQKSSTGTDLSCRVFCAEVGLVPVMQRLHVVCPETGTAIARDCEYWTLGSEDRHIVGV